MKKLLSNGKCIIIIYFLLKGFALLNTVYKIDKAVQIAQIRAGFKFGKLMPTKLCNINLGFALKSLNLKNLSTTATFSWKNQYQC